MRPPVQREKLLSLMEALGRRVKSPGRIYLTGGATALLHGWRPMTVDLKADPEPGGLFEAIAVLKDELAVNIELACPSDFIPELPGWRERCLFIASHGKLEYYHYDPYSQALSKIERAHPRDLKDAACGPDPLGGASLSLPTNRTATDPLPRSRSRFISRRSHVFLWRTFPGHRVMNSGMQDLLQDLPCGALIGRGIEDHLAGRRSVAACLVRLASPRLHRAGLIDKPVPAEDDTELKLYQLLSEDGDSAYSRYNSLLRELASFEHALDHRLSRASG